MNNLLYRNYIFENLETTIDKMCFNVYITVDDQLYNMQFRKLKEQLIGGSYRYKCNGKYRSIKWIKDHSVNVLGLVTK